MFTTVSFLITRLPELNDSRAWKVFEARYTPVLKQYFRKSNCREHVADDLAQETIRRVAEGLRGHSYQREQGKLRNWIGGIARNMLREHWRSKHTSEGQADLHTQFWASREDPAGQVGLAEAEKEFDAVWVRARLSALIRFAAQTFDTRDLRCYFLVEIHKKPIKEVARRLGISESSVFTKRKNVATWFLAVGPRFISAWEQ